LIHPNNRTISMSDNTSPEQPIPQVPLPRQERFGWIRRSLTFRAIIVAILVLLLLIPLGMVEGLIWERQQRRSEVETEVGNTWGGAQTVTGPVLAVPYDETVRVLMSDGSGRFETRTEVRYAHFLPEELNIEGSLEPQRKHRAIYEVAVYGSHTHLTGSFGLMGLRSGRLPEKLNWSEATIQLGITDLRSIKEQVTMRIGSDTVAFEPGLRDVDVAASGLTAPFPLDEASLGTPLAFDVELNIHGSTSYSFTPLGRETHVRCASTWPDPSFNGAFLPDTSTVTPMGFTAEWKVLHLNRSYPQEFTGSHLEEVQQSAFGVFLIQPVNDYQKNTRAAKYGVMLIVLVFLVFFFVEVLQRLRIHPIQYLLVGFALCVFYTLLIAISEHLGFGAAYIISAVAVIGLVVFYSASVFKVKRATQLLGLIMLLVFGFMFTLINEQDHALLFGSIGLFIVLALVMAVSRRIDWENGRA
jgi:inner membrane protein